MDKLRKQLEHFRICLNKLELLVDDAEAIDLVAAMRADIVRLENLLAKHQRQTREAEE
jgi:hypothetical protein